MKLEFLGIAGAIRTPRPGCGCRMPQQHPVPATEATFRQALDKVAQSEPKRVIFAHIEEPDANSPDELEEIAHNLRQERGWDVTFAYDTLMVELANA